MFDVQSNTLSAVYESVTVRVPSLKVPPWFESTLSCVHVWPAPWLAEASSPGLAAPESRRGLPFPAPHPEAATSPAATTPAATSDRLRFLTIPISVFSLRCLELVPKPVALPLE